MYSTFINMYYIERTTYIREKKNNWMTMMLAYFRSRKKTIFILLAFCIYLFTLWIKHFREYDQETVSSQNELPFFFEIEKSFSFLMKIGISSYNLQYRVPFGNSVTLSKSIWIESSKDKIVKMTWTPNSGFEHEAFTSWMEMAWNE